MARKRAQSGRSGGSSRKTASKSTSGGAKAKTSASRSKTKTTARSKAAPASKSTRSRPKKTTATRSSTRAARSPRRAGTPSKAELVERLVRRLGRLKREQLEALLAGVESGHVNLATVAGGPAVPNSSAGGANRSSTATVVLNSLKDVLEEQLVDLYSAETQIVQALPKLARAASDAGLRDALEHHLEETKGHVRRLEQIFGQLGMSSRSERCKGMAGLIEEGDEIVQADGVPAAKDAALIAAAQRVEHYEIAAYGTARTLAEELGLDDAKRLLGETLNEESNADELLTKLATGGMLRSGINVDAVRY